MRIFHIFNEEVARYIINIRNQMVNYFCKIEHPLRTLHILNNEFDTYVLYIYIYIYIYIHTYIHTYKGKSKVIPLQAQRVGRGRGIAILFHDRGTRRG